MVGEEIDLGIATETKIKMSYDGKLMAMFTNTVSEQILKIYSMDENVAKIPNNMTKSPDVMYKGGLLKGQKDIGFIKSMKFDNKDKYFIGCGPYNLFIFEISTQEMEIYNLPLLEFDRIFHIRFESLED